MVGTSNLGSWISHRQYLHRILKLLNKPLSLGIMYTATATGRCDIELLVPYITKRKTCVFNRKLWIHPFIYSTETTNGRYFHFRYLMEILVLIWTCHRTYFNLFLLIFIYFHLFSFFCIFLKDDSWKEHVLNRTLSVMDMSVACYFRIF